MISTSLPPSVQSLCDRKSSAAPRTAPAALLNLISPSPTSSMRCMYTASARIGPSRSSNCHIVPTTLRNPQNCIAAARWSDSSDAKEGVCSAVWHAERKANSAFGRLALTMSSNVNLQQGARTRTRMASLGPIYHDKQSAPIVPSGVPVLQNLEKPPCREDIFRCADAFE